MTTDLTELLRLEIERPPDVGELINLVLNPSGDLGAWGWVTPVAGTVLRSVRTSGVTRLVYTSPGGAASHFTTEKMAVAPGMYVAANWLAEVVVGTHAVKVEWLDLAETVIGSTTATSLLTGSATPRAYGSYLAPASTAYCRLRVDHYDAIGGNPVAGAFMQLRDVTLTAAATTGALGWSATNLLPTPNGEYGAGAWGSGAGTIGTSSAQQVGGRTSLTLTKTGGAGTMAAVSPAMAVVGGRDYAFQARSRADTTLRTVTVYARWFKAGGQEIATTKVRSLAEGSGAFTGPIGGVATAPTNAATVRLRVDYGRVTDGEMHYFSAAMVEQVSRVGAFFDGDSATTFGVTFDWSGTPGASTSVATGPAGDVGTLVPVAYQNILGPTSQISVDREGLNVGSITVKLFDAVLDPTQTDLIQPGKRFRLVTTDGDVIFAGKTLTAKVTYHLLEQDEHQRAEVNLTAVDPINALAAAKRNEGVATVDELPYVLEGAGVPWSCNGSGDQVPTADVVAYNDNASALDQVAVTRDSVLGYAWVDRNGVVQVWDRDELDGTVAAVLDEDVYNADLDIDFDLDRIINSVSVVVLRVIATSGVTEEVTFGPYVDTDSYRTYGEHHADYVVQGIDASDTAAIADYAQAILDANATPRKRVNQLVIPVREAEDLPLGLLDLYDLVNVVNDRAGVDEDSRVETISHEISPGKWLMTLGFAADGAVAPSSAVPAPPPGVGAVKAETDTALQELYDLADANAAAAAAAAATGTAAQTTANGKNTVTYSSSAPGSTPNVAGDIWYVRSGSTISAQYEGLGSTSWASRTLTNVVVTSLDAGALTAGTAFVNALSVKTNFTLGDASVNGVIQSYNFAGSSVGVYIDKYGIVAKGGSLSAAAIIGGSVIGAVVGTAASGARVELSPFLSSAGAVGFYNSSGVLVGLIVGSASAINMTSTVINGDFDVTGDIHGNDVYIDSPTVTPGGVGVFMGSSGKLFPNVSPSLVDYKRDLEEIDVDPDALAALVPLTYRYLEDVPFEVDDPDQLFYGYMYDDAAALGITELLDDASQFPGAKPEHLPIVVLAAWRKTHARLIAAEATIADLITRLDRLEA